MASFGDQHTFIFDDAIAGEKTMHMKSMSLKDGSCTTYNTNLGNELQRMLPDMYVKAAQRQGHINSKSVQELWQNGQDTLDGVIKTGHKGDGSKVAINLLLQQSFHVSINAECAALTETPRVFAEMNMAENTIMISNISTSRFEAKHIILLLTF